MNQNKISYGIYNIESEVNDFNTSDVSLDFIIPQDLIANWKKCGIISNFIAQYNAAHYHNPDHAISSLSTITNELIENAINCSDNNNALINISLKSSHNVTLIETINTATNYGSDLMENLVTQLKNTDINTLLLSQIEAASSDTNERLPGIGIINMIKTYEADIGIKIDQLTPLNNYNIAVKMCIQNTHLGT